MATTKVGTASRESSIDFARGAAMLCVFFAHFSEEPWVPTSNGVLLWLHRMGMIASPTFVLVSGLTLAFVLGRTRAEALPHRKLLVLDRALFMLVVVHAILVCSDVLLAPRNRDFRQFFITDLVALNLMLGVILLPPTSNLIRLTLGACFYVLGWAIHLHWHPVTAQLALAQEILTGPSTSHALEFGFPVLQWAGVFLLGTVLGEGFLAARTKVAREGWAVRLIVRGVACSVLALGLKALALTPWPQQFIATHPGTAEAFSLFGKLPPSPLYLLFFGGLGACIIGLSTLISLYGAIPRAVEWVTAIQAG